MKICMVGTGYVGLVSGTCFAETGNHVVCADIDEAKVARMNEGEIPIYEPGLEPMVVRNRKAGRLTFSSDVGGSIAGADMVFVAVGTPPRSDGGADLSAVDAVAKAIRDNVTGPLIVVNKSTVPVGTNARVRKLTADAPHRVHVVSNPEFLKEGDAISDFLRPDRIVVGLDKDDTYARDMMARLYHPVNLSDNKIVWMSPESAELTKYVANTMLAMRISFMNEVAGLCEKVGADVNDVRHGVGSDGRIGPKFLYAGPGYGGSCFPKDVKALVHTARDHGLELELASTTDRVNVRQKGTLARKLKAELGDLRDKNIAVWGVAFKPKTDDIRESPALTLIDVLLAEGANVTAHDPEARETAGELYGDKIAFVDDAYDACKDADALVLVTEWREYQSPDFGRIKELLRSPVVVDGRNIWAPYRLGEQGFAYRGIGVAKE